MYGMTNMRVDCMSVAFIGIQTLINWLCENVKPFLEISKKFDLFQVLYPATGELYISTKLVHNARYTDVNLPMNWGTPKHKYTYTYNICICIVVYFIPFTGKVGLYSQKKMLVHPKLILTQKLLGRFQSSSNKLEGCLFFSTPLGS